MIQIQGLSVRFPNETDIRYRDFTFEDQKSYVLLGASGCGKSTLLNLIAGILAPAAGTVTIDGRNMTALSPREHDRFRAENIGFVFQDFKLIEEMSVEDNIRILELEKVDMSPMTEILSLLGMADKRRRRVARLSGGEKQRVALARALVKRPAIVLADEPTGSLNYEIGREVARLLTQASRGACVIAVTHDERLAELFDVRVPMDELLLPAEVNGHA